MNFKIVKSGNNHFLDYEVEKDSWKNLAVGTYDHCLSVKAEIIIAGTVRKIEEKREQEFARISLDEFEIRPENYATAEDYFYAVDVLCAYDKEAMTEEDFERIFRKACVAYWKEKTN